MLIEVIGSSGWGVEVTAALSEAIESGGSVASAAVARDAIYYSAYAKSLPETVREPMRSSVVRKAAITRLLKLPDLELDEINAVLANYSYPDLLRDYARDRLVKRVGAELEGVGEGVLRSDHGSVAACLISVPQGSVKLKTVEIVSDREALVFYHVALFKEARALIDRQEFPEAVRMLMEARRHGYDGVALFRYLYTCYLLAGSAEDAARTRKLLVDRYGSELRFEDFVELADLAESSPLPDEADHWYAMAESRVRKSLSLDMLINQP